MLKTLLLASLGSIAVMANAAMAEDPAVGTKIELAKGKIVLQAPKDWKVVEAKSSIIEYEFSAPSTAKPDEPSARVTIMGAGGTIEDNIERWYGQFSQSDGKSTKEKSKVEKFDAAGQTIHYVDIPGSFKETMGGGPFSGGKTVVREDYRMLGAIVVTKGLGQYFIKITGPSAVCEKLSADFKKMLKEIAVAE